MATGTPPAVRIHLDAALANAAFVGRALTRGDPEDYGWALTAVFYAALHVVRSYLACRGIEIASHQEGEQQFHQRPEISRAREWFKTLKQLSEAHRYYHTPITRKNVEDSLRLMHRLGDLILPKVQSICPEASAEVDVAPLRSLPLTGRR